MGKHSRFFALAMNEEREVKEEEERKKTRDKELRIKKMKYSELLREEFVRRVRTPSPHEELECEESKYSRLTVQEIKDIGNSYLFAGNKCAKKAQELHKQNVNTATTNTDNPPACSVGHRSPRPQRRCREPKDNYAYVSAKI
jgi:hypothetical protein